ncbi:unnamed protein product, partial [Adineta ricciae]
MNITHIFVQYKAVVFLSLFIYVLFWLIITILKQAPIEIVHEHDSSTSNLDLILIYLSKCHINLLLIDPFVLEFLFVQQLSYKQLRKRLITFGIFNDSLRLLEPIFSINNFSVKLSNSDHIFIEYDQQIVHLAVLHPQNSYFLIQKNLLPLPSDVHLSYGDTPRVIEPQEAKFRRRKYRFSSPQNASHFLWLYNISQFIECNHALAKEMETNYHLYQNTSQLDLTIRPMRMISNALNQFEKHHWLAGGTLLGWYRHCGLIPYTQDVDFGLFAEEYDE